MEHPRLAEAGTLLVGLPLALVAALTCMQLICLIGVMPNTSIFGATMALGAGRLWKHRFRRSSRQNLIQTLVSGAGFTAANAGLVAAALVFVLGYPNLVAPMLLGSLVGVLADIYLGYRLFGLDLLPAQGAWPQGYATAAVLRLQDETGARVKRLTGGIGIGIIGGAVGLPALAVGMGFLGEGITMLVLGLGMLAGGLLPWQFPYQEREIGAALLIGAGVVQLFQTLGHFLRRRQARRDFDVFLEKGSNGELVEGPLPASPRSGWLCIPSYYIPFALGALVLAVAAGLISRLNGMGLFFFLLYAPLAALISSVWVGWSAMLGGWLPVFGSSLFFFAGGLGLGLPPSALALLMGYILSTGPLLADIGNDLKAGWILRGFGQDQAYEREGRRQQLLAEWLGALVGIAVVYLVFDLYLGRGLVPPIVWVWEQAFMVAGGGTVSWEFTGPALVGGACLQLFSPARRSLGIALALGLVIANPAFGLALIGAVIGKHFLTEGAMEFCDLGLVIGDGFTRFLLLLLL